ncbi:E3 ubiquitin-protein ligase rnf213-alpha-like isoform X2 [Mizuhopecten yessoensis]|uniref:E3 ubiquitin-protein ligase rnf213-alpha-like isoform X2 n=1 Tax=Mizuhopecten yessoensis TaxID=6573 RepID=UPI000B45D95E|nr:E3 ubiquitin-protein ligase rnf213-alpha-like isoform X2 [Mizuhopecten yessoensis]
MKVNVEPLDMMKCQGLKDGRPCGSDLQPDVEICPECGTCVPKVSVLEKPKDTVACPGTDDENPCNNKELVRGKKFCDTCGWRVNQSIFEPGSRVCGADSQGTRCTGVIRKQETTCPICKQIQNEFAQQRSETQKTSFPNQMNYSNSATVTGQTVQDETIQEIQSPKGKVEISQQVGHDTSLFLSSLSGSGNIQIRSSSSHDPKYAIPLSPGNQSQRLLTTPQRDHDTTSAIDSAETLIPFSQALQASSLFKLNEKPKGAETVSATYTTTKMDVDEDPQTENRASVGETDTEDSEDSSSDGSSEGTDEKQLHNREFRAGKKRKMDRKNCNARIKKKKKREKKREKSVKSSSSISAESGPKKAAKGPKEMDVEKENSTEKDNSMKNNSSGSASREPTSKKGKSEESRPATTSSKNVQEMDVEKENSTEKDNSMKNNSSGSASREPTSKKGKSEESRPATTSSKNVQHAAGQQNLPTDIMPPKSSTGNRPPQHGYPTRSRSSDVAVVFKAILSPTLLDDVRRPVCIFIEQFSTQLFLMEKLQTHDDGLVEYKGTVTFQQQETHRTYWYKYGIMNQYGHFIPENFCNHQNRRLNTPNAKRNAGIWYRFDGVVNGHLDVPWYSQVASVILKRPEHQSILKGDANKSLQISFGYLMDELQTGHMSGAEILDLYEDMITGLNRVYTNAAVVWSSYVDFEHHAEKVIKPQIQQILQQLRKEVPEAPQNCLKYAVILTLVHLIMKNGLGYHSPWKDEEKEMASICALFQLPVLEKNALQKEVDNVKGSFQGKLSAVTHSMQQMVNFIAGKTQDVAWLSCIPMLHFLWGESFPFEIPERQIGHRDTKPVWWGVTKYSKANDKFKDKPRWNEELQVVIDKMAPLFHVDYLLPRTLMTVVRFEDLEKIVSLHYFVPDISLAKVYFTLHTKGYLNDEEHKVIQSCLEQILEQISGISQCDTLFRIYKVGKDVLEEALRKNKSLTIYRAAGVVLQALVLFQNAKDKEEKEKRDKPSEQIHLPVFQKVVNDILKFLQYKHSTFCTGTDCKENLRIWDSFLKIDLPPGKMREEYIDETRSKLKKIIAEKTNCDSLLTVYCECVDIYGDDVQDILSEIAFKVLDKGSTMTGYHSDTVANGRYRKLLSDVLEKQWTKLNNEELFAHALNWPPFRHFVEMFYVTDKSDHLSEDCNIKFTQAVSAILDKMERLKDGTILVEDLHVIAKNFDMFERLVKIMFEKDKKTIGDTYIRQMVDLRYKELKAFKKASEHVAVFLNMCSRIEVDCKTLLTIQEDLKRVECLPLVQLCKPRKLEEIAHLDQYQPEVTVFGLDMDIMNLIPHMGHCLQSNVFTVMWDKTGQRATKQKTGSLTIDEMLKLVWQPTKNWWNRVTKNLQDGSMKFDEFKDVFGDMDYQRLGKEFSLMEENGLWIQERMDQIQLFRDLANSVKGAEIILKVVDKYDLKGDFTPIQLITSVMSGTNIAMNTLDQSLEQTCAVLRGVDERHIECLKEFIKCEPLILWLKESMPSGLKELKVFVDLASISAGEGDIEIAKVRCLHSATTGYAPLIFNLTDDIGYKDFLKKCKMVWKELDADPNLPKKLHDTNRKIEWLKTVKKAHGSVEVTSLAQTEAINTAGFYRVGRLGNQEWEQKPELKDVISLHVSEDENGARQRKLYHYDLLHDLQSRLMLVAGKAEKGKEDVDRFTMILDSTVRLANIYIKLVSSGCVLFSEWKATFLCDRKRPACAFITFEKGNKVPVLKGRKATEDDDVSSIVPQIAKFMEKCYEEWLKYIADKRDEYYELNYLTIDQMVILQRELVKVGTDEEPSKLIFPLLSGIKKDCSMSDLISAMKAAQREVESMDEDEDEEMPEISSVVEMGEKEKELIFIKEVMKIGYSEALARNALCHFKTDEIDDALLWCMDNEDEMDTESAVDEGTDKGEANPQTVEYKGWTNTDKSISNVTSEILGTLSNINKEVNVDPLIEDLKKLWEKFLTSISSSVSDYLSVEHLGLILRHLKEKDTFSVNRDFIPGFEQEVPNLILCPQNDILNTVLTIYMNDGQQPLPQPDEVLICSSHTTLDQLDIFWRRAVFNQSGKIYCLANSDLLDYEVSDKGEQCLKRHMQTAKEKGIKYKLVVLCSTENEYKSRIVAALERFRRPQLPVANQQLIQSFLKEKLKVDKADVKINPASLVDFGRSTVRVVKSLRAGVGKSLYKTRRAQDLEDVYPTNKRTTGAVVSIPLHEKEIDVDTIMARLLKCTLPAGQLEPRIFHIDISYEVYIGVDAFLFQLLVLGCLVNSAGYVWIKSPSDHYLVEAMPLLTTDHSKQRGEQICFHRCFDILPDVTCRSPEESCNILQGRKPVDYADSDLLFDKQEFKSPVFQRPYQYLRRLDESRDLAEPGGNQINCLQTFLRHCGVPDPSWAELKHFVCFLNSQLQDFEVSAFCGAAAKEDLPGFDKFVLKFLIQMSRDFATRSLVMSEESPIQRMQRMAVVDEETGGAGEENIIKQFQMRRTWESSPHPYLFFNPDQHSMTFVGFKIQRATGDMLDQQTGAVLERHIMQKELQDSLIRNKVNIDENFDGLQRHEKILKLCSVMGMEMPHDPDDTYELTTDNVKKIMAIYMRFKCDIPVIIMGETGCGKTRLVKFMCELQCPPGVDLKNMILMKVHGGTKTKDIIKKVEEAENIARENADKYGQHIQTVLFFDEANTTEAIGLIKEIMCDRTIGGNQLKLCRSLKIIAACNPYRKHSDELIKRLEQAGLGYHVDAEKTTDTLGRVPLRRLVYRVQPLPQSLLPLVWDFGQLDTRIEELYIRQMVLRYIRADKLPRIDNLENVVSVILTASQEFMRKQKDECSFVSLRDVERVLEVMSWFYNQSQGDSALFDLLNKSSEENSDEDEMEDDEQNQSQDISDIARSLLLALGVCYHACLKKREEYRKAVAPLFTPPCQIPGAHPAQQMLEEIERCQDAFLTNVELGKNIAHNQALKENVFMMVTCIELRIPLFLVGKPGSSKSLAKTVVGNAMQGHAAHTDLFRGYKEVQMMSYQCSPLSTPQGISGMFRQCAQFQRDKDLSRFVSVVVLDEVGLAEDSPRMPLKTLHPLLEDGCEGDEKPEPFKKVAFIGISNWALDPAKMNRGILVQREVPELEELTLSAKGICQTNRDVYKLIEPLIPQMAKAYLELFESALKMREFFGLRDFYSLLKMVYAFADQKKEIPTWHQMQHAIMRNFGGMDDIDPVSVFEQVLTTVDITKKRTNSDPDCSPAGLIQACLTGVTIDSESRYLLLLTENYGALTILQQEILKKQKAITIFGSSFPSDQEYTQVCRNINRIKVCMETGNTVVLLNLENLYESLYDALNQYYVEFGGERYVDLGLGTHRVKCRVHKDFRLIVVAEKQVVYDKFPIPLINRLEKHFLNVSTMLTEQQLELAERLEKWAKDFVNCQGNITSYFQRMKKEEFSVGDVFMGYHADSCAAIVLHMYQQHYREGQVNNEQVYDSAKRVLLWCATPDAVMRLPTTPIAEEEASLSEIYWQEQQHQCLSDYLYQKIRQENSDSHFAQVTTHSKLITSVDLEELSCKLGIPVDNMVLLNLQSFDTEQQFCRQVRVYFGREEDEMLLIVQSDCGDQNASLVACARYCIQDELQQLGYQIKANIHAIFIIQLPRIAGGCFSGFQCGHWHSLHIDDIRPEGDTLRMSEMQGKSLGMLVHHAVGEETGQSTEISMETDTPVEQDGRQTDMDVDEEDIQLDFNNMSGFPSNPAHSHKLPVENLVLSCIQAASAMVKDTKMDTARSTERVRQLLDLRHYGQTNLVSHNLVKGICKHLDVLLTEKEKSLVNPGDWLATEAAKAEVINTAGTFRRARTQCMETKVTPILTGIIAFMDTNRNLDSLYRATDGDWVQQLWLGVINCTKATGLQYSQLVSPGHAQQELPEVVVRHTGTDGHLFTAQMPFSWLYFRLIENLLNTTMNNTPEAEGLEVAHTIQDILNSRPIGIMLQPIINKDRPHVLKAYINDFVHMIYQVSSRQEHQLVCESVSNGAASILQHQAGDGVAMLVAIHLTYHQNISRLRNFSSLNRVWPECSETITDFQKSSPNFFLCSDEEMTLDVMGLRLLLEKLEPEKETLNKVASRAEWLKRVRHYRPVVERLLDMVRPGYDPKMAQCGPRCVKGIGDARLKWTAVLVVKLFIEHVCSMLGSNQFTINRIMPLWAMMNNGAGADMKTLDSLEKVEKFLKMCNKTAVSHYFHINKNATCRHCEKQLEGPPIVLPCEDKICSKCYNDIIITKELKCPVCQKEIPDDFSPEMEHHKTEENKKYFEYKKRINSFFMEVVSQLCFADDTPPSDDIVQKLLSYITRSTDKGKVVTKEMTIFDDSIDPTPVLRSFLLQLLLRTSGNQVNDYLSQYLVQAKQFVKEKEHEEQSQLTELYLLILQCVEDVYHQDVSRSATPEKDEVQMATKQLKNALNFIALEELNIEKLYALAETRFALCVVAKYVQKIFVDKSVEMTKPLRQMIDTAAKLCEECDSKWPCIFFIKQLCRCYGLDSYQSVCKSGDAYMRRWLQMLDLNRETNLECSDLYVVCGEQYITCREMITKCLLGQDPDNLIQQLQGLRNMDWKKRVTLLLAVYREVTMSYVYTEDSRKTQPETIESLMKAMAGHQLFRGQEKLLTALFQNTMWQQIEQFNIHPGMEQRDQSIVCLLAHAGITFLQVPEDNTLLQPLITLALLPQNMATSFLPTMPQDDITEVQEALLAARNGNENPVIYRCPRGHRYVIGDCGRPDAVSKCRECGDQIGGQSHTPLPGNVKDDGIDQTQPGHILGRADQRTNVVGVERKMSQITCAILRLLTHVAMLLGTNQNVSVIGRMIKPNIPDERVVEFLLNHIKLDISSLQRVTGRSVDDVLLLIHKVLSSVTETYNNGRAFEPAVCSLVTKKARNHWEEMFSEHCLFPLLQDFEGTMKSCNAQLIEDKRLGSDPLLCLLFEIDTPQHQVSAVALQEVASVWRFRSRISMDHLTTVFQTKMGREHQILKLFLEEDCHLRAVRLIPSILRLQRMLIHKYQMKLDSAEARVFTVERVQRNFKEDGKEDEVKQLIQDFAEAWNCVRQALEHFTYSTSGCIAVVSKEFCSKQITDSTPISMLLPTKKDAGLCSYILVYFLLKKQNEFLEKYCRCKTLNASDLQKVKVHNLSPAHLISYHPDRDILPIVLANCNYSFEVGKGTKIEYDFGNIERQLGDRFLFAKSYIDIDEIDVMTYRSEVTNAVVFKTLREKIPQIQLGSAVRHQICQELRSLPDICDCLDKLDITISFLKSVGEDQTLSLDTFMSQTLKLTHPLASPKFKAVCQCQHVQCLWLTLAQEKTKCQAKHKKDVFDSLGDEFRKELSEQQQDYLQCFCDGLQTDKLDYLMELLFECIMLMIAIPQNQDDEDYIDILGQSLQQNLEGYLYSPMYDEDSQIPDWMMETVARLDGENGEKLLVSQCVNVWLLLFHAHSRKERERSY